MVSRVCVFFALFTAAAALDVSDPKQVSSEVAARCMTGDIAGATSLLESHGKPIGWQHGKYMLMSCFTDETGKCLLDNSRCAWLQQCLEEEGPCGAPPMTSLLELPGGEVALNLLKADANASKTVDGQVRYKLTKILEVAKMMAQSVPTPDEIASSLLQQQEAQQEPTKSNKFLKSKLAAEQEAEIAAQEACDKCAMKKAMIDFIRYKIGTVVYTYKELKALFADTEQHRRFTLGMLTMPLYYLGACGMKDEGVLLINDKPVWAKYTPNGPMGTSYVKPLRKFTPTFKQLMMDPYYC